MFKKTDFDRTKLFDKIKPLIANISSAKKSPDNSHKPVESSQSNINSNIDSNIDINDIIRQIIERMAPKGKESIDALKATCQPMIIEIMIHGDGTATVKTDAQRTHANSSSNRVEPVEGEEPILSKRESQKTKPVLSNFFGIENAIAGLKKAAAATQEAPKPNQELINMVERLAQMNNKIQNATVDIPTPNYDAAVKNERKELEEIGDIMDSYNTMIEGIPGIIAGIDKTTTGNEEKIANMKIQLERLGKNIENYIQTLTKKVEEITSKFGNQNLDKITALCEKLKELAGTFEKATAAVSGTGNKIPEKNDNKWDKIKENMKKALSTIKTRGKQEWNTFTSKLDGFLSQCGETAKTWKEKFTTLLQQFIKGEKDYGTIKGEIEKEENSEIKGLLLTILEEVKKITEQLKTKKNIDDTETDKDLDTDTTATPAQNGGKSGEKVSKPQAVVEKQEANKDNKGENAEENSDNSITKIGECPKGKPNNYETYKIDYPKVGTKYKTPYGGEVSIVKYLKDDNGNWKVVLNKDPIGGTEEEVTDSIESIILFYLQENANNKRKRVNEEKTQDETQKQDETENTNTQGKENPTPNTSKPAKKPGEKGALSRFSAQVGEKIKNAWNWFKGLFKKKEKQSKTETTTNTPKKTVSSQPRQTTTTTSENIENNEKLEFKVGDQYYNDNNLAFTVSKIDGDNIEIIYAYENRKSTSTRDGLEKSIKQNKFKKKEK